MDLLASPSLVLQMGDRLMVVGSWNLYKVNLLGNSLSDLEPNLIPIFLGIFWEFARKCTYPLSGYTPGCKTGTGRRPAHCCHFDKPFGPKYGLLTTTMSANLMLRELELPCFVQRRHRSQHLFVETVFNTQGLVGA